MDRQPIGLTIPWFKLALAGIFILSLVLRFWRLGQFNTLVFDEVYYPVFANRYLIGEPVYNAHPPLSQLIIAVGMWIGSHLPFGQDTANALTGSLRTTFSYRWFNALTGSFIPVVVGLLAYQLTSRRSYGAIAAFLMALDGLFLVESRYGLNNIYLVFFGLLGHLCLLLALRHPRWSPPPPRHFRDYRQGKFRLIRIISDRVTAYFRDPPPLQRRHKLTLAGIFLGLAAAIKWNGLGFLLGIYLLWIIAWILRLSYNNRPLTPSKPQSNPLPNLTQLNPLHLFSYFALIPSLTYAATWVPHLIMNPNPGFWQMQQEILTFHQRIGSGSAVHPYCSPWYSWLIMGRPVAYFYHTARNPQEMIPAYPPLPSGAGKIIYDVHAMGNPLLWWLSTVAIILFALLILQRFLSGNSRTLLFTPATGLSLYLVCNYAANLLPWIPVTRCLFLYHYMAALVFAILAIAWILDVWLQSSYYVYRQGAIAILLAILLAFLFWLPLYIGLPLSPQGYQMRMWFSSWI
ncbi:phospholipid carrier-dependent glycosyltransferase [Spirulina sp. CS-785/01]|nr:phospholipid carrier-dependent glycosyltransferase [Spirulina sp. CS-785/01]MDB9313033.1 phospholipid carrier-dependent glycosyltransferase [Spirulina sp. CS-785/01]